MQNSRLLARIIGPVLILPAVGVFLNFETYQHMIAEFSKSTALCYLSGLMALISGLLIVQLHDAEEARWTVVITILGWITVANGAAIIVFPGLIPNLWYPYAASSPTFIFSMAIPLVLGVFLTIKGYWG